MVDSDECYCNKISIIGDKKCHLPLKFSVF